MPDLSGNGRDQMREQAEAEKAELYQQIGHLKPVGLARQLRFTVRQRKGVPAGRESPAEPCREGWNLNLIAAFTAGTALNRGSDTRGVMPTAGNVIYYGGELNVDPHNVDYSFDVTRFNRVAAQQLASNRRTFPSRFADPRADSVKQIDFSIIKSFAITERVHVTYRCEFFTSTNRAIFNAPDLAPTSSTFGKITGQVNTPRRIQMALRLVFRSAAVAEDAAGERFGAVSILDGKPAVD